MGTHLAIGKLKWHGGQASGHGAVGVKASPQIVQVIDVLPHVRVLVLVGVHEGRAHVGEAAQLRQASRQLGQLAGGREVLAQNGLDGQVEPDAGRAVDDVLHAACHSPPVSL